MVPIDDGKRVVRYGLSCDSLTVHLPSSKVPFPVYVEVKQYGEITGWTMDRVATQELIQHLLRCL